MEIAAVIFVLVVLGIAFIAFRILKKTLKMAFRAGILLGLIALALIGGALIWMLG